MAKKKKPVASFDSRGPVAVGTSDVIRWGDTMMINGTHIDIAKAVKLGHKHGLKFAELLERDLKSETGLLLTFPVAMLMDQLQRKLGSGSKVLELTKA